MFSGGKLKKKYNIIITICVHLKVYTAITTMVCFIQGLKVTLTFKVHAYNIIISCY